MISYFVYLHLILNICFQGYSLLVLQEHLFVCDRAVVRLFQRLQRSNSFRALAHRSLQCFVYCVAPAGARPFRQAHQSRDHDAVSRAVQNYSEQVGFQYEGKAIFKFYQR